MGFPGLVVSLDKPLGEYVGAYVGRATDPEILYRRASSGGAVTALLLYMLDKGIVDAVVVAKKIKGLQGEIVVARSREEVLEAAGSKWSVLPFTLRLKETLSSVRIKRAALVGLPCQAQFLYQVKNYPILETDFGEKIGFVISLFCMGTFATEAFLSYIQKSKGVPAERIVSIRTERGRLIVVHEGGELELTTEEVLPYMQLGCLLCPDYTGVFADISAGSCEFLPKHTILITRTEMGDDLLKGAAEEGYIELREAESAVVEGIANKATMKIKRSMEYMAKIL